MGLIIADGFDDRWILNNGYGYGDYYDGWGLYDDLYHGDDYDHFGEYQGVREMGRYGGWAMMLTDDDMSWNYCDIEFTLPSGKDWCGGIAINSADEDGLAVSFSSATKGGPWIEFDPDGEVIVRRTKQFASTSEIVVRSNAAARLTMWGWIYVTYEFHAGDIGADYIKVWVNGELVIDVSGTTLNFGGAITGGGSPSGAGGADDIWIKNNTDTILPEAVILALFPNAAGTDSECTPVGEVTNYLNVDEFEQDFDSTYNLVDTGEKDSFNMDAITAQVSAGVVHALVARFFVKGDAGNALQLRPYVISGGTKYNGTAQAVVEGRYTYIQEIWDTNPDTASAWTMGEVDAVQIGYEAV